MGGAILTHQTGPVHRQQHVQLLDGDIMYQLIVGALQEGGVDRQYRFHPLTGQPGGQSSGVLLGDRHIKIALRVALGKRHQIGAFAHGRGDAHQTRVLGRGITQPAAENIAELGLFRFRSGVLRLKLGDRMVAHRVGLRRFKPLALARDQVQKLGAGRFRARSSAGSRAPKSWPSTGP